MQPMSMDEDETDIDMDLTRSPEGAIHNIKDEKPGADDVPEQAPEG